MTFSEWVNLRVLQCLFHLNEEVTVHELRELVALGLPQECVGIAYDSLKASGLISEPAEGMAELPRFWQIRTRLHKTCISVTWPSQFSPFALSLTKPSSPPAAIRTAFRPRSRSGANEMTPARSTK